jgi:hypothetical protein
VSARVCGKNPMINSELPYRSGPLDPLLARRNVVLRGAQVEAARAGVAVRPAAHAPPRG